MRVLFCGDVVGRAGRTVIQEHLPRLRDRLDLDFIVVNGENAAHGFGITPKICQEFYDAGADVITTGNHVWDRREIIDYIDDDPRLLRPMNYPAGTPGRGAGIFDAPNGRRVLVVHPMGRLYMDPLDDPFKAVEAALAAMTEERDAAKFRGDEMFREMDALRKFSSSGPRRCRSRSTRRRTSGRS